MADARLCSNPIYLPEAAHGSSKRTVPERRTPARIVGVEGGLHPAREDAGIITSFPGLGPLTGARVLAETGDDRSRFQDAKGLKAYAGAAPITRASGKTSRSCG
jgi:transposase